MDLEYYSGDPTDVPLSYSYPRTISIPYPLGWSKNDIYKYPQYNINLMDEDFDDIDKSKIEQFVVPKSIDKTELIISKRRNYIDITAGLASVSSIGYCLHHLMTDPTLRLELLFGTLGGVILIGEILYGRYRDAYCDKMELPSRNDRYTHES